MVEILLAGFLTGWGWGWGGGDGGDERTSDPEVAFHSAW